MRLTFVHSLLLTVGASLASTLALANATLTGMDVNTGPEGETLLIEMKFDGAPPEPSSFAIENPARISIDLPATRTGLAEPQKTVGLSILDSYVVIETGDRTRVVLNLTEFAPHAMRREGDSLLVEVVAPKSAKRLRDSGTAEVLNVDFRRSETGAGQVKILLGGVVKDIDVREEGGQVVAVFRNTALAAPSQRLDVLDFATPVSLIDVGGNDDQVRIAVRPVKNANFERIAYQVGNLFTIEFQPLSPEEVARRAREDVEYTGEKINFSFQNIDLRALLQIIADIAGKNLVVSDSVAGELTLRLVNVPWDQALDIVMRTKGLTKNIDGDVMWVAPTEEVAANEKQELEALKQRQELAPLVTELIQINYANARELQELILGEGGGGNSRDEGFLSDRGKVSVDERTSVLIVQDTREQLEDIRMLVRSLDIPVRQVLIEARVVVATDDFARSVGVRAGVTGAEQNSDSIFATSGTAVGQGGQRFSNTAFVLDDLIQQQPFDPVRSQSFQNIDFGATGAGFSPPSIAFALLSRDYLLDLELSAIQAEGSGEVISSPRVMTTNGKEAYIEQGEEIPFTAVTGTRISTLFKKAVLALRVVPQITPDNRILLTLEVSKDSRGQVVPQAGGGQAVGIDTKSVNTEVLVNNGETVVLGGVFEQEDSQSETKVPFLGDIPLLGALFRQRSSDRSTNELLIFITPKIIGDSIIVN